MFDLDDEVEDGFGDRGVVISKNENSIVVRFNSDEMRTYLSNGKLAGSVSTFSAFDIRKLN